MPRQYHYAQREKKPKPGGQQVAPAQNQTNVPEQTESLENVVQMQRVVGNRVMQRSLRGGGSAGLVQRLMTADQLIGVAGAPQKDKFFGLKKMSGKYKAVLDELKSYDDRLSVSVETAGVRFVEGLNEMLDHVVTACNGYTGAHEGDSRTPHIVALRDVDVPKERALLGVIANNPGLRAKFAGKSMREALLMARDQKALTDAVQSLDKPAPSGEKQAEARQKYTAFLDTGNEALTGTIGEETKSSGTQPFRGSDTLTGQGKLVTEALGQSYIKDTIMPLMSNLLSQAIGPDVLTSAGAITSPEEATPDEKSKMPATVELINNLYGQFVQGLLVDSKGGIAVPADILEAAAETFARVFDTVENDPNAEHSAMHAARISVVNMIFLRFINPVLMKIASQLPGKSGVQFIAMRISQIFQGQANGLDLVKKFPEMSESEDLIASTGAIIDQIINQVVENGQTKALVLKAKRPEPTGRTRGRMVIGNNRRK